LLDTQLEVKLDTVEFDASTAEYLDFLIVSCLHSLTSVHIVPTNVVLGWVKSRRCVVSESFTQCHEHI